MRRRKMYRFVKNIPLSEIGEPDPRFNHEPVPELVQMISKAIQGKLKVRHIKMDPRELFPHDPATLARARAGLLEEPSLLKAFMEMNQDPGGPWILTYRDPAGRLRVFDDYPDLVAALEVGLERVRVVVLGEGDERLTRRDAAMTIG